MTITTNQPRLSVEEVLRQRAEAEKVFTPPEDGSLNLEALTLLIEWAEADEEVRQRRFANWGQWRQNEWGTIATDDPNVVALVEDEDRDTDDHILGVLGDLNRNGVCGTAFCQAGQAVSQAGYDLVYEEPTVDDDNWAGLVSASADKCVKTEYAGVDDKGRPVFRRVGDEHNIEDTGARILGLTTSEADAYFFGGNSIERLKQLVTLFCNERDIPTPYPDYPYPY